MAHLLLPRLPLPLTALGLGLGISISVSTLAFSRRRPVLLDAAGATPLTTVSESFKGYTRDAKVPVWRGGRVNPGAIRQISGGSVLGGFFYGVCWFGGVEGGRGRGMGIWDRVGTEG